MINMKSQNSCISDPYRRLIKLIVVILSAIIFSGCNLLGISPQRRPAPAKSSTTPKTSADLELYQKNQTEMVERIESLEKQLEENRQIHQEKLQNMDRTIALLEQTIRQLKQDMKNQLAARSVPKTSPKASITPKSTPPATQPISKPAVKSASKPARKPHGLSNIIETPLSSKAVETVSLSKVDNINSTTPGPEKKSQIRKLPVIGLEPNRKEQKRPASQTWEDPDLEDSPSPIQLRIVPGAKRRYQKAFKVYSSRNYEESIKQFNAFLIDFPNDQDADNSQFWIGQSHFQLGNTLHAEKAFRKVLRNYAHGSTRRGFKTPDATLMLGRIYLIRKKPIKARYYFEQVIRRYPDSRSSVKAAREIEAMDSF